MSKIVFAIIAICLTQVTYLFWTFHTLKCVGYLKKVFESEFYWILFFPFPKIAAARHVRDAPAPAATSTSIEDGLTAILDSANETFIALNAAFLRIVDSENNTQFLEKVQTQLKSFANDAEATLVKLNEEVSFIHSKTNWFEIIPNEWNSILLYLFFIRFDRPNHWLAKPAN